MAQELSNKVLEAVVPGSALGLDHLSEFLLLFLRKAFADNCIYRFLIVTIQLCHADSFSIACVYLLSIVSRMLVACNKVILISLQSAIK